jgi:transcriptional regulator with XRE-family HTH domain
MGWSVYGGCAGVMRCSERSLVVNKSGDELDAKMYYFNVLPVRRPPMLLESLNSFVMRLAADNHIRSIRGISEVCFPIQGWQLTRQLGDIPPLDLSTLSQVAVCPESRLLETTVYYIATKFGRSTRPQALSSFLSGSLSTSVRYCPECLRSDSRMYYRLMWRFLMLKGCPSHGCKLVDRCWRCTQALPLFTPPFHVGECASCGADLREAGVDALTCAEGAEARSAQADLEFYLSPQPLQLSCLGFGASYGAREAVSAHAPEMLRRQVNEENGVPVATLIGQRFSLLRRLTGMTQLEVESQSGGGLRYMTIKGIESGDVRQYGGRFCSYLSYAQFLNVGLSTLMRGEADVDPVQAQLQIDTWERAKVVARKERVRLLWHEKRLKKKVEREQHKQPAPTRHEAREAQLLKRIPQAVEELQSAKKITRTAVCQRIGLSRDGLRQYPRARTLLDSLMPLAPKVLISQHLVERVDAAKSYLANRNVPITHKALYEALNASRSNLAKSPLMVAAIDKAVEEYRRGEAVRLRAERERELLERLEATILLLESKNVHVTQNAICTEMGITASGLRYYPVLAGRLDEVTTRHRR